LKMIFLGKNMWKKIRCDSRNFCTISSPVFLLISVSRSLQYCSRAVFS
jgi:hypothetical protein